MPGPDLVRTFEALTAAPLVLTCPEKVTGVSVLIALPEVPRLKIFVSEVTLLVVFKVAPLMLMILFPKAVSLAACKVPPVIDTPPENELFPPMESVPAALLVRLRPVRFPPARSTVPLALLTTTLPAVMPPASTVIAATVLIVALSLVTNAVAAEVDVLDQLVLLGDVFQLLPPAPVQSRLRGATAAVEVPVSVKSSVPALPIPRRLVAVPPNTTSLQ